MSTRFRLEDAVVSFCNNRGKAAIERMAPIFRGVKLVTNKFRQFGAGGLELAFVASGRIDSFLMPDTNIWDVAAGAVIVEEAGGRVTDFKGKPYTMHSKDILASNGILHEEILEILRDR